MIVKEIPIFIYYNLSFRMDTSALYSDMVLPAATWYEKNELNATDLHSYIHPLSEAVKPLWESKGDWDAFKFIAKKFSELAIKYLPNKLKNVIATPLMHDFPNEITQPAVRAWKYEDIEIVLGKNFPNLAIVERDYHI
jgi:nitrate reductase alpha subunit